MDEKIHELLQGVMILSNQEIIDACTELKMARDWVANDPGIEAHIALRCAEHRLRQAVKGVK